MSCTILYGRCTDGSYVRVGDHDNPAATREYLGRIMGCEMVRVEGAYEYWESKEYGWGYRFFDYALVAGN